MTVDVHAPFRWRRMWEKIGVYFDLEIGDPIPLPLATHMPTLCSVWQQISSDLLQTDHAKAVDWEFGDFVFGAEVDMVSDMTKIRLAGFAEEVNPVDAVIRAIERQEADAVILRVRRCRAPLLATDGFRTSSRMR